MRRFLVKLVAVLLILSVCLLAFGAWALHNEDFLKARVASIVEAQTGRQLTIDGPFRLELGRRTTLSAGGVSFANAAWAERPAMVSVGSLRVTLDIPALLDRAVWLPDLGLDDCTVGLVKNGDGQANWDLGLADDEDRSGPGWTFRIDRLDINRCRLVFDSPARKQPMRVEVDQAQLSRTGGTHVTGKIDGRLNDRALSVNGWMDPPRAFSEGGPVAMELGIKTGNATLDLSASFTDAAQLSGPDLDGRFRGPEIAAVLEQFALPPFSEGDFDFRVHLTNQGGQAIIDVNGDLGSLEALAQGELDRLANPTKGQLTATVHGPDLQALGQALGLDAPLGKDFELEAKLAFTPGAVQLERSSLQSSQDRAEVSGTLSRAANRAGTGLNVSLHSQEAGRWLALAGRPDVSIGALALEGKANVDDRGDLHIDGQVDTAGAVVHVDGGLGPLEKPVVPDLDLRLQADDLATLGTLLETDRLPQAPVEIAGHVKRQADKLALTGFLLKLDKNRATLDGTIDLERKLEAIELRTDLDIPDLSELGKLFGRPDLPPGPAKISGTLKRDGKQLAFTVDDGDLGDIRVDLDGQIADLDQPARIDANFDLHFPSANTAAALLPGLLLPEGPMSATGRLQNLPDRTRIENLNLRVAQTELTFDGYVGHDQSFELKIGFSGPDLSELQELAGISFPALPFDLSTGVAGSLQDMAFQDLYLRMGDSEAQGNLRYQHGADRRISGTLAGRHVNLTHWIHAKQADDSRQAEKAAQRYVFDDTPVLQWSDLGWAADVRATVEELEIGYGKYNDLEVGFLLAGTRAEVKPFALTPNGGGRFQGELVIDGASGVPQLEFQLDAENYPLQQVAAEGQDPSTLPVARFSVDLEGKGRTHREMAASLEGEIRLSVGPGDMAPSSVGFLLSDFVTEVFRVLLPWTRSNDHTRLQCAVAAADVHGGMVELDPMVINARQVTIISQGTVDLETERIDLTFNSKQRRGLGISASDLVNPFIKIGGTLAAPAIELDPASTVVKGGLAVATMGISILAGSLADRYLSSRDPCGDAQKAIDKRDAKSP